MQWKQIKKKKMKELNFLFFILMNARTIKFIKERKEQ